MHQRRWLGPLLLSVSLTATSSAVAARPQAGAAASRQPAPPAHAIAVSVQIQRWANWTQRELGEARGANLRAKSQCLDAALSELHALRRVAQHQEQVLTTSDGRANKQRVARDGLQLAYLNARSSYRGARECGAVRITNSGSVSFWIDPRVAPFEPLHPEDRR